MSVRHIPLLATSPSGAKVGDTNVSHTSITLIELEANAAELRRALASGAVFVNGTVTTTATGYVVREGGVVTQHGRRLQEVDASAGVVYDREKEETKAIVAKSKLAIKASDPAKDRTSLVQAKLADGAVTVKDGTLAEPGESAAPAADSGNIALATVLCKANSEGVLTITDVRQRP